MILSGIKTYWRAGPAHLEFREIDNSPTFLMMLTIFGFYVEVAYIEDVQSRKDWVAYIPDVNLGRIEVDDPWAGQNPMHIPKDFCLTREQCAEAVKYFCETGGLDPRINWVKKRSTGWDFTPGD